MRASQLCPRIQNHNGRVSHCGFRGKPQDPSGSLLQPEEGGCEFETALIEKKILSHFHSTFHAP